MFARTVLGFSLACLLAASPVLAVEESEPFIATQTEQTASETGIVADKRVPEETIATRSESDAPVDADS